MKWTSHAAITCLYPRRKSNRNHPSKVHTPRIYNTNHFCNEWHNWLCEYLDKNDYVYCALCNCCSKFGQFVMDKHCTKSWLRESSFFASFTWSLRQNHFPLGTFLIFRQVVWYHCIGQSLLSQHIAPLHVLAFLQKHHSWQEYGHFISSTPVPQQLQLIRSSGEAPMKGELVWITNSNAISIADSYMYVS